MNFLSRYSKQLGFKYSLMTITRCLQNPFLPLTEMEKGRLEGIGKGKRRDQWLAGRFAAKKALLQGEWVENVSVLNKPSGKPYFFEKPETCLTLSHSEDYIVALVSPKDMGVDLEFIEKRPDSFISCFLSDREKEALEGLSEEEKNIRVTMYWTRKEAVSKFLGLGGSIPFQKINTKERTIRMHEYSSKAIRLYSGFIDNYIISIATEEQIG